MTESNITNWDQAKLESLINDQEEENLHLDYKAGAALAKSEKKKNEISKDVSAMANSDGGVIIYGIKEYDQQNKKHLPEKIDPISRNIISKEWLEQVINSNISPRIKNIIIEPIQINSSTENVVYVVDIPKSETAHQARDMRYYKRYNFESISMYDYEIRDILNRSKNPVIDLEFILEVETRDTRSPLFKEINIGLGESKPQYETFTYLKVFARNNGRVYANYINSFLQIPYELIKLRPKQNINYHLIDGIKYVQYYGDNTKRDLLDLKGDPLTGYSSKYGPARFQPVFPTRRMKIDTINIINNYEKVEENNQFILWRVYADNAEVNEGQIKISDIEKIIKN